MRPSPCSPLKTPPKSHLLAQFQHHLFHERKIFWIAQIHIRAHMDTSGSTAAWHTNTIAAMERLYEFAQMQKILRS